MLKSDSGREIRLFELCENFLMVEQGACQIRAEYFSQKLFHVILAIKKPFLETSYSFGEGARGQTIIISDKLKTKASKL